MAQYPSPRQYWMSSPPGRRAAKLVPQVLGDDPELDRAAAEARAHRRLEQAGERELFQPHVAEAVVGHATDVADLLTIGGDDTAFATSGVARAREARLLVAPVPKTIDNDRPLPPERAHFRFTTAVDIGTDLVKLLMKDAATTDQGFFVTGWAGTPALSPSASGGRPGPPSP